MSTLKLFYSYSRKDQKHREQLETHLALLSHEGEIEGFADIMTPAGRDWRNFIDANLNSADLILLLVSADFLASDHCRNETIQAMQRHDRGEACVIPVLLRSCEWESQDFSRLQVLPSDHKPATNWEHIDDAFKDVAQGIRSAISGIRSDAQSKPPTASANDFELTDVRTFPPIDGVVAMEVFIANRGKTTVSVTGVRLTVDHLDRDMLMGYLPVSATYDYDLSDLQRIGETAEVPVSQSVAPGDVDRFVVRLAAPGMKQAEWRNWRLQVSLATSEGQVDGGTVELMLPVLRSVPPAD